MPTGRTAHATGAEVLGGHDVFLPSLVSTSDLFNEKHDVKFLWVINFEKKKWKGGGARSFDVSRSGGMVGPRGVGMGSGDGDKVELSLPGTAGDERSR